MRIRNIARDQESKKQVSTKRVLGIQSLRSRQLMAADGFDAEFSHSDDVAAMISYYGDSEDQFQEETEDEFENELTAWPVAIADNYETALDTPVDGSVLDNDFVSGEDDRVGTAYMTAQVIEEPSNGELSIGEDGNFTYRPDAGFSGTDQFVYVANDGETDSEPVQVTIDVGAASRVVAASDSYSTEAGTTVTGNVLDNDEVTTVDADTSATAQVVDWPSMGELTMNEDGSFSYIPNAGYVGTDSFVYVANDGENDSAPTPVTIEVTEPEAERPVSSIVAVPDIYETAIGTEVVGNVLENDYVTGENDRGEHSFMTAGVVEGPYRGNLSLQEDGSFSFTPHPGFRGTERFVYIANDGENDSTPTTVTIEVGRPSEMAVEADSFSTPSGAALRGNVLDNDELRGADEAAIITARVVEAASNGNVEMDEEGEFTYLPNPGFVGTDEFTYVANDGENDSEPVTVTIEVTAANPPRSARFSRFNSVDEALLDFLFERYGLTC